MKGCEAIRTENGSSQGQTVLFAPHSSDIGKARNLSMQAACVAPGDEHCTAVRAQRQMPSGRLCGVDPLHGVRPVSRVSDVRFRVKSWWLRVLAGEQKHLHGSGLGVAGLRVEREGALRSALWGSPIRRRSTCGNCNRLQGLLVCECVSV